MKRHHEPPVLLYFSGFPGWLAWFSLQMFCLNNKIHFSLANANNSASFKRKMVKNHRFCSFTNNKQTCEWSCQRFRQVSGQDRKIPLALGTNQIAGFGGFCPPASLEKNKCTYSADPGISEKTRFGQHSIFNPWIFLYFTLYKGFTQVCVSSRTK